MLALAVSLFIVLFLKRKGTKVRTASRGETGRGERRGWGSRGTGLSKSYGWWDWGLDGGGYVQGSRSCDRGGWEHRAGTIVGEETRREERETGGENLTVSVL